MNYEDKTDPEINVLVAKCRGLNFTYDGRGVYVDVFCEQHGDFFPEPFDPCNNPEDAWPSIEQVWSTLMSVTNYDYGSGVGESKTTIWDARMHRYDDSKLRAAMIVYLMMQEAK